jgi:uncharacterized LabA/DUF88 family protein
VSECGSLLTDAAVFTIRTRADIVTYRYGQKQSARLKGVKKASPQERDVCDPSWRVDFGNLIREVAGGLAVHKAILVGSTPPQTDTIWDAARRGGFEVITHERAFSGKEKAVDTEIVAKGTEIVCTTAPGILRLLSGDRDFIPLVKIANSRQWETEMWAFSSSYTLHGEMAQSVTRVTPLDDIFTAIGRHDFVWP